MAGAKKVKGTAAGNGPLAIQSRVVGEARLLIQILDRRYTPQEVLDGLNTGELKYAAGQIRRAGEIVAGYQIESIDDRLEDFRLAG
jgi:hypothetical protein